MLQDAVEFADNPEPRCPCVLLLDTSGSMRGPRIDALNAGLLQFGNELRKDAVASRRVEIAIVTFSTGVELVHDFATVDRFQPRNLQASGSTYMASGIERALDLVEARKQTFKSHGISYYRPWVFMITDGHPEGEGGEVVQRVAHRLRQSEAKKSVALFAVAVEGADMEQLAKLVPRQPVKLKGLSFSEMFNWLSASMQSVSHSDAADAMVGLPPIGWGHVSQ